MRNTLTVEQFKNALPPQIKQSVNKELIDQINATLSDPEAMEIFRENLLSFTSVLQQGKFKLVNYISAVRYVGFKVMGSTNRDAYIRTFPDKYDSFLQRGVAEKDIDSYVTAYNKSKLVNLLFEQTLIPVHIMNAPLFQKAINVQAELMVSARSEMVRMQAAGKLMDILKPPETKKIELDIGVHRDSVIDDYETAMRRMVEQQMKLIAAGGNIKQIANAKIVTHAIEEEVMDI